MCHFYCNGGNHNFINSSHLGILVPNSEELKMKVKVSVMSDSATPWTILSMEFSKPEYWTGYPFPSPGDCPNPGIKPRSPTLQADSSPAEPQGKPSEELLHLSFNCHLNLSCLKSRKMECKSVVTS